MVVHQHAQRTIVMNAAQPQAHIQLRVAINVQVAGAEMIAEEVGATNPTTPADVEARKRQLAEARDIERAHRELLTALQDACGATCQPRGLPAGGLRHVRNSPVGSPRCRCLAS